MNHSDNGNWSEEPKEIWGLWIRGVLLMGALAAVAVKLTLEAIGVSVTWPSWCAFGVVVLIRVILRIRRAGE